MHCLKWSGEASFSEQALHACIAHAATVASSLKHRGQKCSVAGIL